MMCDGIGRRTGIDVEHLRRDLVFEGIMRRGRAIYQARAKFEIMADLLFRVRTIPSADIKTLSTYLGINYRTLNTLIDEGRISPENEQTVAERCRFAQDDERWVDPSVPERARENYAVDGYAGRDTAGNFQQMLIGVWMPEHPSFHAATGYPEAANRYLAKHFVSDCGQSTPHDVDMPLFLEADFGTVCDVSGVRYGFRRVRLDVEVICQNGAKAVRRLGMHQPASISDAVIASRGTSLQPSWIIEQSQTDSAILDGEYATKDMPLFELRNFEAGTRVESYVSGNLHDGSVVSSDSDLVLTPNQREIIKQICSAEIASETKADGWLVLSRHNLTITRNKQ
jgi:hypothetical protein